MMKLKKYKKKKTQVNSSYPQSALRKYYNLIKTNLILNNKIKKNIINKKNNKRRR